MSIRQNILLSSANKSVVTDLNNDITLNFPSNLFFKAPNYLELINFDLDCELITLGSSNNTLIVSYTNNIGIYKSHIVIVNFSSSIKTDYDLAQALKEICNANTEIKIIGTRHGEKLYETLCTREEMIKAEDMGDFYRIPADNRDLNYAQYYSEGEKDISSIEDYHSHNTQQQDVAGMKKLLMQLPLIRKDVFGEDVAQMPG